ncbi:hypothetical protein EON65_26540, partial [archaeon]
MSIYDILPESITVMACTAYFFVDTCNKLINDFIFRVPSYQKGLVRIVEYLHHFLSLAVAIYSEIYYKQVCDCTQNPVLRIALAELSTPFLVAWRQTKSDLMGGVFVLVFIAVRIVYQGGVLIPYILHTCMSPIIPFFSFVYVGLNVWFMVMILRKIWRGVGGRGGKKGGKESMECQSASILPNSSPRSWPSASCRPTLMATS